MGSERTALPLRTGRRSRSSALTALAFLAAALSPQVARAEPSAADKETARSLMARGREQLEQSELKAALDSFQAADAIMHVPSMSFAVAKTEAHGKRLPVVAVSAFAVGGVGILVGTITGLLSSSKTSSLKEQCPAGNCPPETYDAPAFQDDLSSAKTLGTVSTISFLVGGVGVAAGVVALFLPSAASAPASTTRARAKLDRVSMERESPRVSPYLGVGSAGLVGTF